MPIGFRKFLPMARSIPAMLLLLAACAAPPPPPAGPRVELPAFRAPAVPLFVQTPYLHTWLCGDRLADEAPKLWNGQIKGMVGMLRIDGKAYRFMGLPSSPLPALRQDSVRILPTRTVFEFSHDDVRLRLEFLSPLDPRDLRLLSLPVGLLRAEVSAQKPHAVQVYFDITGEWAVGSSDRRITWDGLFRVRPSQPRLFRETYNYPDWGEVHWVAVDPATSQYGVHEDVRQSFVKGSSPLRDTRYPRAANDEWPVFAHHWDLGKVDKPVARRALLAHTRREIVDFYGTSCAAYWTRHYSTADLMVASVAAEFESIRARAAILDEEVVTRAHEAGGVPLACLASLAFRQAFAANEPALLGGEPVYFSKSMDISGVSAIQSLDVLYSSFPALKAFNPELLRLQLLPIWLALARSDWRETHVMSDLGAYPIASGQLSGAVPAGSTTAKLALLSKLAGSMAPTPEEVTTSIRNFMAVEPRDHLKADVFLDRVLKLGLVSPEDVSREIADVRSRIGKYGASFDPRKPLVRLDALFWIAALAEGADRLAIASAALRFFNDTASRVPAPDQYDGDTGRASGTQGRPVMGAVFAPLLIRERR